MGYIEDVQAMDLSDEVKQNLIASHRAEVDPLRESNQSLSARSRQQAVETEVSELSSLGFSESPGLLKFVRRVFLSTDAEEPGAVLLSDGDMGLSGDQATGASGKEEISVAGALREFIKLMPRNEEGKLKVALSEQHSELDDHGRPTSGGELEGEEREKQRRDRAARLSGRSIDRAEVRGKRYHQASITGGD